MNKKVFHNVVIFIIFTTRKIEKNEKKEFFEKYLQA